MTLSCRMQRKEDPLHETVKTLCSKLSKPDVCVHYSLKYKYAGGADQSFQAFQDFCSGLAALDGQVSVLVVSGGGKKKKLDTVQVSSCAWKVRAVMQQHAAIQLS